MNKIAIIGSQQGDEAKSRMAHYFSSKHNYNWVVRFNGSSNAGHVVYRDGKKYVHHLLPSADYRNPNIKSFLSSGMVINLEELVKEIETFSQDFPHIGKTIYVDPDAFVILEKHITQDKEQNQHIGSTNKGVGPAYTDKIARKGTRIYNFLRDNSEITNKLIQLGVQFKSVLELKQEFINSSIIFEGAQSVLLDLNCSPDYPYVTCSDCTVSGIYSSGFHFLRLDEVYGIAKPYLTKVGNGNFPTEYFGDEAEQLRQRGNEYGSTTGRPRRCGALDLVSLKYAVEKGGITALILTKMDILNGQKTVKVCVDYGKPVYSPSDFIDIKPVYKEFPGWSNCKNIEELEEFIYSVSDFVGVPIHYISTGVGHNDVIINPYY
jgi:adenylosuccinate synthase